MIIELQKRMNVLDSRLDYNQKRFFNLKSVRNFLIYYDKLEQSNKPIVEKLLKEYFEIMEDEDCSIDKKTSTRIAFDYIFKIGKYYTVDVGFKVRMTLRSTIVIGMLMDFLLFFSGILKKVYYIPIFTLIMLCNWGYLKIFYENKNKVFGLRY